MHAPISDYKLLHALHAKSILKTTWSQCVFLLNHRKDIKKRIRTLVNAKCYILQTRAYSNAGHTFVETQTALANKRREV